MEIVTHAPSTAVWWGLRPLPQTAVLRMAHGRGWDMIYRERMAKRTLLLVDYANTLYRGVFAVRYLSFAGEPTGGLYSFVNQICTEVVRCNASGILICDDAKPYLRSKVFPEYKAGRKRNTDPIVIAAMNAAWKQTQLFMRQTKMPAWRVEGMEADDLLFVAAAKAKNLGYDRVVVRSGDSDLYQLFRLPIPVLLSRGKSTEPYYTRHKFENDYGISPSDWRKVVALAGSHNGTPGLPGIATKRAIGLVKGVRDSKGRVVKSFASIIKENEDVLLYFRLTRLPFEAVEEPPPISGKFNRRQALKVLSRYGVKLNSTMREAFDKLS